MEQISIRSLLLLAFVALFITYIATIYGNPKFVIQDANEGGKSILTDEYDREQASSRRNERLQAGTKLSPVVVIVGLTGSRLHYRSNKTQAKNNCKLESGQIEKKWILVDDFRSSVKDCSSDYIKLLYDPDSGFGRNMPGVDIKTGPFGKLNAFTSYITGNIKPMINKLIGMGYEQDVNILFAPYDFRLAPQQLAEPGGFFDELTQLIESAQADFGNQATVICHSVGCRYTLIYFRGKSSQWRSKHVNKVIALSTGWGGSFAGLEDLVLALGFMNNDTKIAEYREKLSQLIASFPSYSFSLPLVEVYGGPEVPAEELRRPFFRTPEREYGVNDVGQFLLDVKLNHQYDWYLGTTPLAKPFEPVNDVKTICIHGSGLKSHRSVVYQDQDQFPSGLHRTEFSDGDGAVNLESLAVCGNWSRRYPDTFEYITLANTSHIDTLSHQTFFDILQREILTFAQNKT